MLFDRNLDSRQTKTEPQFYTNINDINLHAWTLNLICFPISTSVRCERVSPNEDVNTNHRRPHNNGIDKWKMWRERNHHAADIRAKMRLPKWMKRPIHCPIEQWTRITNIKKVNFHCFIPFVRSCFGRTNSNAVFWVRTVDQQNLFKIYTCIHIVLHMNPIEFDAK